MTPFDAFAASSTTLVASSGQASRKPGLRPRPSDLEVRPFEDAGKMLVCSVLVVLSTILSPVLRASERSCPVQPATQVALTLNPADAREARINRLEDGSFEITAIGSAPTVGVLLQGEIHPTQVCVLSFEYFSAHAGDHLHAEFGALLAEPHAVLAGGLSHSEAFTSYSTDLAGSPDWKGNIAFFRIGFD